METKSYRRQRTTVLGQIRERIINQVSHTTALLSKYFGTLYYSLTSSDALILDIDGTVLNWNQNNAKLQGYSEQEILGQHVSLFYPPQDRQKGLPEQLLIEAIKNGKAIRKGTWVRKDGTSFFGCMYLNTIKIQNEVLGFIEVLRKIDEKDSD